MIATGTEEQDGTTVITVLPYGRVLSITPEDEGSKKDVF